MYNIFFVPLTLLYVLFCWIYDLCHWKCPRSLNSFGPVLCHVHSDLQFECVYRKAAQKDNAPARLPLKRRRALTNPQDLRRWQKTGSQSSSLLLSELPIELRQIIYSNVLKGSTSTLHIVQKLQLHKHKQGFDLWRYQRRLGCWPCQRRPHISLGNTYYPVHLYPRSCSGHFDSWSPWGSETAPYGNIVRLLLTCRQIYTEGVGLLYSGHTFSFAETRYLSVFATTILRQRLNMIRKLHLERPLPFRRISTRTEESDCSREEAEQWRSCCKIVNGMEGLQDLCIDVFNLEKRELQTPEMERDALQPLMMIRAVKVYVVRVSWNGLGFDDETAPFRILRPGNERWGGMGATEDRFEMDDYQGLIPGNMA